MLSYFYYFIVNILHKFSLFLSQRGSNACRRKQEFWEISVRWYEFHFDSTNTCVTKMHAFYVKLKM